jgi:hypothetical protein
VVGILGDKISELLRSQNIRQALQHIREFVAKVKGLIEGITVENLIEEGGINPYMVAALNISSMEEIAELFVYRRVERSLGTSFGYVIEAFLRDLLGGRSGKDYPGCGSRSRKQQNWICWWDIVIERESEEEGKKYKGIVLSVKSGPADVDKDIVERFVEHAREAMQNSYKPYLVLTYGKRAFAVAESTLRSHGLDPRKYLLVGRDIFRTFLGDPNLYDTVIDLIRGAGGQVDIFDLIEKKVKELAEELRKRYGDDVTKLLKDLS